MRLSSFRDGSSFCSGHDLGEMAKNTAYREHASTAEGRYWQERRLFADPVRKLRELRVPTICKIQGYCLVKDRQMFGELNPCGGGDPIPLQKQRLVVGRQPSCDIILRFPNVSSRHCEFQMLNGYWHVRDLEAATESRSTASVLRVALAHAR